MTEPNVCFVFGSNLKGIHGAGAAQAALLHWGAIWGKGEGLQGNSYAIPTKSTPKKTLPLKDIQVYVDRFLLFAEEHPNTYFILTPIGCGLAGYLPIDIAPMFETASSNVYIPLKFTPYINSYDLA